eukprot:TRINITY_DN5318_c0_g1_i12.p1 TRINITY_DN5318_c0_g1~~TRINITY_DN5318_c0_g1_i12.p1  ORF type:complete len:158 (+),score=43.61 TRINITY_DN5318_c0_g1_i12:589-1062(+)
MAAFTAMKPDTAIDAVVVGLDTGFDYQKLCCASVLLQMGKHFLASNADVYDLLPEGRLPGNGAVVEALSVAAGKTPEVIGKPFTTQIDLFMEDKGLKDKSRILVIGDRLDTDIELGRNAGVDSALVLTGVGIMEDVENAEKLGNALPTYILNSLQLP